MSSGEWIALLLLTAANVGLYRKTLAIRRQIKTREPRCTYEEWEASR